jgi:predicted CoA-substrate-specific enzyme activase
VDTLGIDVGSVSVKAVVLSAGGDVRFEAYRRTQGRPLEAAAAILAEAAAALGPDTPIAGAVVTGSGKELLAGPLAAEPVNEIVAHATAAWTLHPDVRSIVEIGGQDSKFIRVGRGADGHPYVLDHAFNELCAAGTGAFLDQMAERLGMSIEDFADASAAAVHPARVAGRCSVFAKTDMIHLQQRACPPGEIVAGLCFALVRTYLASLCHGRAPEPPILFQGGVAANDGVARALVEVLGLSDGDLIRPAGHKVMGALGAALLAREHPWVQPVSLGRLAGRTPLQAGEPERASGLAPLATAATPGQAPSGNAPPDPTTAAGPLPRSTADVVFLGIDVGSVSTKAVAIDAEGRLAASAYLPTAGRPVDAVHAALDDLHGQLADGVRVARVVTTGSGRHLARDLAGADEVVDEISAQARAAVHFVPDADTVFEIGGQDSKYIRLSGGRVARFQMNRACAAGTGAFLEEQSGRLGIDVRRDFADAALSSRTPVRMGSRCTVFMDSDLVHHLQHGASKADLCAGLAYSVARNYLDKVVGSRPVGARVVFQGGVARNAAVCAAFEAILGRPVAVHPHPETSGAWGAALIAREAAGRDAAPSRFRGFATASETVGIRTFECPACENQCEIQQVSAGEGRRSFFGSVCGRFERGEEAPTPAGDAFATRERLLAECAGMVEPSAPTGPVEATTAAALPPDRGPLAIPFALSLADDVPFWRTFWTTLGYRVTLSGRTDSEKAAQGLARVPEEFCQPVKILFGHVHDLLAHGAMRLFLPHLRQFRPPADTANRYACAYTQAAPYVVRAQLAQSHPGVEVVSLETPVPGEEPNWIVTTAQELGVPRAEVDAAFRRATAAQERFRAACRAEGRLLLDRLAAEGRPGAVLLGRPYNTSDRRLNLNLARRLATLGIQPIPFDFLPLEDEPLPAFWARVRWGFGREQLQAARIVRRTPSLSAVIVMNFGCGPDAFIDQYLENELTDTPHIVLEFDDHQAEAGLVTRLEAFARTVRREREPDGPKGRTERRRGTPPGVPTQPLRDYTYWVPFLSDHSRAFVGALKSVGCRVNLLPPTDDESWQLGLTHAYGRECHPYVSFLGDLVRASRRPDFVPAEACYYGPSYFGPCLLPQFMVAMKLVLDRIGLADVSIVNIADPPTMAPLGRGYVARLALGMYAIDRLYKWKIETEPYDDTGAMAIAYARAVDLVEDGLARRRVFPALREAVAGMAAVRLSPANGTRPRIGVIGDTYTRINEHANDGLYDRLRGMGFEVWPSCSLVDVSLLGGEQLHAEMIRQGKTVTGNAARVAIPAVAALRALVDRHFPDTIRTPQERQFPDVSRVADTYASHWIDKCLSLNLSRVEELQQAGASGVINAMCHNCMLGTVTSALLPAMRRDHGGMATCTLVYEGLQSTHNVNRLEAFAHQVRQAPRPRGVPVDSGPS